MNNVHEDQPVVFQTRWALSYLRGPLTREQIQTLMAPRKQAKAVPSPAAPPAASAPGATKTASPATPSTQAAGLQLQPASSGCLGRQPARRAAGRARVLHPPPGPARRGSGDPVPARAPGRCPAPLRRQEVRHRLTGRRSGCSSRSARRCRPMSGMAPRYTPTTFPELDKIARAGRQLRPLAVPAVPGQVATPSTPRP